MSTSLLKTPAAADGLVGADLHHLALLDRLDRVLLGDVDDLVPEHAGQLRLALDQGQRTTRDVHQPAWRGQRVDAVGVEHDEPPLQSRPGACLRQRGTDQRHVLVNGRVLHHAVPLPDSLADRLAQF